MSRRARCARRRQAGFTLVELTVSLLAGLIVALGIMTLSKEATRTFNEEIRGSAAEATLRTAVDRLRADIGRAGYMSTGNIMLDPMIAKAPSDVSNVVHIANGMGGIRRLASVSFVAGKVGQSQALNTLPLSLVQPSALAPDMVEFSGNMTTSEQFEVQMIMPAGSNCTQILLSSLSPAIYRMSPTGLGTPAASAELRNAFQPVPATLATQFIVRLVDTTGHVQYLATCPNATAAGFTGTQPYLSVDTSSTPIQTSAQTKTQGGASGYCVGCLVNPVQIVRWEVTSSTQEASNQAQYAAALDQQPTTFGSATVDPAKYDLMRTYVDATGTPVLQTSEIIAEYAVDLKLAFSVDKTTLGDTQPNIATLAFDDPTNATWAPDVSATPQLAAVGPQRIRSVRARVATRAAQPDRTVNVPVTNFGAQQFTQTFLYRYCINAVPSCATSDGTLRWARARTVTTEIALPNTSGAFY
ncbi:MAG TPA: prepilin-type N-terminal cleavage/methylation domain-containing protein [Polyangiaceae bacterium]|jgi:hypothetical protein